MDGCKSRWIEKLLVLHAIYAVHACRTSRKESMLAAAQTPRRPDTPAFLCVTLSARQRAVLVFLAAACVLPIVGSARIEPITDIQSVQAAFSPRGESLQAILNELRQARSRVDVAMFYLSNENLVDALCYLSFRRGVTVRLFLDKDMAHPARRAMLERLTAAGVQVLLDEEASRKSHLKCAVIDDLTVISGAANWTQDSFAQNFEDSVIVKSETLAKKYRAFLDSKASEFAPFYSSEGITRKQLATTLRVFPDGAGKPAASSIRGGGTLDELNAPRPQTFSDVASVRAFLSPDDPGIEQTLQLIDEIGEDIQIAMFFISSEAVIERLMQLTTVRTRSMSLIVGGDVMGPSSATAYRRLVQAGIPISYDQSKGLMHFKTTVINDRYVVTGSANWSESAGQRNFEDILIFDSPTMARYYHKYLDEIRNRCETLSLLDRAVKLSAKAKTRLFTLEEPTPLEPFTVKAALRYLDDADYLPVALALIRNARQSVVVSMYHAPETVSPQESQERLFSQLIAAAWRGVYVHVLLECPYNSGTKMEGDHAALIERLRAAGVDARFNTPGVSLHEKMIVVDDFQIVIGSHNWSGGSLEGRVHEGSALLVLPEQDPRFREHVLNHLGIENMDPRELREKEVEIHRHLLPMGSRARADFIHSLP